MLWHRTTFTDVWPKTKKDVTTHTCDLLGSFREQAQEPIGCDSKRAVLKDAYEVLRAKELEMEGLRIEIEALRIAAPLLSDDGDNNSATAASARWVEPPRPFQVPQAANSDPQPEHAPEWKERTVGFP